MSIISGGIEVVVEKVKVKGRGAIILTGPSSCGKGEVANALRNFLSIPKERHFSMGDILRMTISKAREDDDFRETLSKTYGISDKVSIFEVHEDRATDQLKALKYKKELLGFFVY